MITALSIRKVLEFKYGTKDFDNLLTEEEKEYLLSKSKEETAATREYTLGPWKVKHSESKTAFNIIGTHLGSKYKIARCSYFKIDNELINKIEKAETEANAHLIAAAPDLLAALENLQYCVLNRHDACGALNQAMKAIAKATGEKESTK